MGSWFQLMFSVSLGQSNNLVSLCCIVIVNMICTDDGVVVTVSIANSRVASIRAMYVLCLSRGPYGGVWAEVDDIRYVYAIK